MILILKRLSFLFLVILIGYAFVGESKSWKLRETTITKSNLATVLRSLGDEPLIHKMESYDSKLAEVGEQLIKTGKANYKDKKGKRISSYFQCIDCHSLEKETNSLTELDPQKRLDFSIANNKPFYPASTLYGLYNRTSFYNDDYYKKYGDLVIDAKDSIENAIQLCAEFCASGRPLEDWELSAMLHYFKREELKMGDLDFTESELTEISNALDNKGENSVAIETIKSKYIQAYNATFTGTLPEKDRKYGAEGNPENGKKIYDASCIFCHGNSRVTYLNLDHDVLSGKYLWSNKEGYDDESIYQVIRWGTYPITGRQQYMPLYTEERMTDEQLEDLMAYIKQLARK